MSTTIYVEPSYKAVCKFFLMSTLAERLKQAIADAGTDQSKLARAVGIKPQSIQALVAGKASSSTHVVEIAGALGVRAAWLRTGLGPIKAEQPEVAPVAAPSLPSRDQMGLDVPVRGQAVGGDDGDFHWNGEIVDMVRRPPSLVGNRHAFALYVTGDSMVPWKRRGQLLYIDPNRPARAGDYVVVECHGDEGEAGAAYLKMLVAITPTHIRLAQHNPANDRIVLAVKRVKRIFRVLELEELMGV